MTATRIGDVRWDDSARDSWDSDGIPTLLGAALYLGAVGFFVVLVLNRKPVLEFLGKPPAGVMVLIALVLMGALCAWVSMNWEEIIEWFKVRITYPRTGHATPPGCWSNESAKPATLRQKGLLWRVLSTLGGFWFWSFLTIFWRISFGYQGVTSSRWLLILSLGILVTVRGVQFGIYREDAVPGDRHKPGILLQLVRFLWSVLNFFWVWIFLINLLVLPPRPHGPASYYRYALVCLLWAGFLLGQIFSLFPILLPKRGRFQTASLFLCGVGCAFLMWRTLPIGMVVTLFVPGLWAASSGGLRLYRYLRDNPVRSIPEPAESNM